MISKEPVNYERIRKISGSFSWIDHRILTQGFLKAMSLYEILLYFFLILVGDKNGISFYHYDKICSLLKIEADDYLQARNLLIKRSLVAFDQGRFQVLELPTAAKQPESINCQRTNGVHSLKDIFKKLSQ
jgi:hypothetical protein